MGRSLLASRTRRFVADWRIVDPQWRGVFSAHGLKSVFRVKMKFDEAAHEVGNLSEQATAGGMTASRQ